MKKLFIILFAFIGSFINAQDYDFQELCLTCAEQNGYYCGDDPANWTQYAPNGCVINGWLNDGWEDCVDASDENGAVPTVPADCAPPPPDCDTVYVEIPVIEYEYITEFIIEYLDCDTGLPCGVGMEEVIDKSISTGLIYNLKGEVIRKRNGVFIENGKIKYLIK